MAGKATPTAFLLFVAPIAIFIVIVANLSVAANPVVEIVVPQLQSWDIVFYTFGITGIAFYAITMLAMKETQWLSYAVYGSMLLLLWSSLDGTLAIIFRGGDRFMALAPLIIGSITATFGFAHAAYRIEPPHAFVALKPPFLCLAFISILLMPGLLIIDSFVPLYATLNTLMILVVPAQVFPAITWTTLSQRQRRVAIIWPVLLAIFGIGFYAIHFLGEGFSRSDLDLGNRLIFILHIAHTLTFAVVYVLDQVKSRQQAIQLAADEARRAAETALELEHSKQDYKRAQSLAKNTSRQLAEASHDIKQPITALRMAITSLESQQPNQESGRILQAVDYLDQLANSYLQSGNEGIDLSRTTNDSEQQRDNSGYEQISSKMILNTVYQMFQADADARHIKIKLQSKDQYLSLPPLIIVRVLSNFLSNAITHSGATKILLATRIRDKSLYFEVYDNGRGMDNTTLAEAAELRVKGPDSKGSGLGLAIAYSLAAEHNFEIILRAKQNSGTYAALRVNLV